ncbi:MAG: hypothetical protein Q8P22_04410 [Chloroflexota bacterium]|nr:hypothetical protein [Chloroflexota bacterium]
MDETDLLEAAHRQLQANRQSGVSPWNGQPYSFVCPSVKTYPFQWFWDSCFHAVVWSHLDPAQAREELRTLLRAQRADGFIPHRIAWQGRIAFPYRFYLHSNSPLRPWRSELIQPAVLAIALEAVHARSGDAAFLTEVLPGVERYYRWLAENRDPDGDNLISIIHPYESGLDHKPAYDVLFRPLSQAGPPGVRMALRGIDVVNRMCRYNLRLIFNLDRFNVEDVLVNCVYAQGLASLSRLLRQQGDDAKAESYARWAERVEQAILTKCREPDGLFYDLYSRRERKAKTKTVTCLFPLILDSIDRQTAERLVKEHLLNEAEFWLPYPLPTVSRDEPAFNPSFRSPAQSGLWRGPTWVCINWFLVRGLRKHGFEDVATHIVAKTKELVLQHGFREFYNPLTGEPHGAEGFAWSTLVVDMLV